MLTEGSFAPDDGLSRRLKAFACTAPLHDLDARKSRLDWAQAEVYQMAEIAFHAIDQVTVAMDFDRGAAQQDVVSRVLPFVRAQAPDRGWDEHARVVEWVLSNLLNAGTTDRGFQAFYGGADENGRYRKRTYDFKILTESRADDGEVYLRASDEAINVLVGALDTDVESAQIAAEVKLENLIQRGRLSEAQTAAEQAKLQTIRYAEELRRWLEATRRDVRAVDWEVEVPALIERSLGHIEVRLRAETAILTNITKARDEAEDPVRKKRAADLVGIVADCVRRHTQLQSRLMEAGRTFRSEQDRQQFAARQRREAVDLFGQVLEPTLGLAVGPAGGPAAAFFQTGSGVSVPAAVSLESLVSRLLAPPQERDALGAEIPDPELAPPTEPETYTAEQWAVSERLLSLPVPRRLSALLEDARRHDPEAAALVAFRALHAFGPEVGTVLRQGDPEVLISVDDGTRLADPVFGGADLLVMSATVQASLGEEDVA